MPMVARPADWKPISVPKNAVLREARLDERPNSALSRLVTLRHRIIAAILLVGDGNARTKAGKRFSTGCIGEFEEEIPVGQHAKPRCLN